MEIGNNFLPADKTYQPSFSAIGRNVCNSAGKLLYRNDTSLFRYDLGDWDKFTEYLMNKFKNTDKVNFYILSSSAGDEGYSVIMKLLQKYGEDGAKKFFPIIASDIDKKIVNMANKGFLPMFDIEEKLINKQTGGKFGEYFEKTEKIPDFIKDMNIEFDFLTKVKPVLRDKIQFHKADATKECLRLKPDNSLVMARNFWPYLKDESIRIKFANDLFKTLKNNSAVVLGCFDDRSGAFASKNLQDAGFIFNPEIQNVYEKGAKLTSNYFFCPPKSFNVHPKHGMEYFQ